MRSYTEVVFALYDVTAKADSTVQAADVEDFCNLAQLKEKTVPTMPKYATCEHNQFLLDGSMVHFPDNPSVAFWGFWSDSISGADGRLAQPVGLDISFTQPHSSLGITLQGYGPTGEWPSDVVVSWYGAGGVLLATAAAQPDSLIYYIPEKVENYYSIKITVNATNKPNRRVKISAIDYGARLVFSGSDVVSASLVEEVDLLSNELRISTLDMVLYSKDAFFWLLNTAGAFSVLQNRQQITVYEYLDGAPLFMGSFYLSDWSNTSETLAAFTAVSALGLLDGVQHMGGIYDTTFGALAAELLEGYEHEIAPELVPIPIKGYLPIGTRRTALQQLCFAAGAIVDCSRSERMRLFPLPHRASVQIGRDRKFVGGTVTLRQLVTGVEVTAHTYARGTTVKELCKETLLPGAHRLTFTEPMHSYTITGGAITGQGVNYVDFMVSAEGEVVLSGQEYIISKNVIARQAEYIPANAEPNVLQVEGATLVSTALADGVAARILAYYKNRYEQRFKMRLNTEMPADVGLVETFDGAQLRGNIESLSIDLTGGFVADVLIIGDHDAA